MLFHVRKRALWIVVAVALVGTGLAETAKAATGQSVTVTGVVKDDKGRPIPGATLSVDGIAGTVLSDDTGAWRLTMPPGPHVIRAMRKGYEDAVQSVEAGSMGDAGRAGAADAGAPGVVLVLVPMPRHSETVVVQAIRADAQTPITKTDMDREEIRRADYGQEMPFILQRTPSITGYSESGIGAGYSYFYVRGIQQTRINMTFDGAPLNDPEESAVYFANFGDFASAVGSIQIQRGVGASTVGAASYGGSVSFTSLEPAREPSLTLDTGLGSFGSVKNGVTGQTGQLPGGFAFVGRALLQETDGYKDHSGVRQRAGYFALTRETGSSLFKLSGFSGLERTHLAFLATEKDILERDPTFNALAPEDTDRFVQSLVQAQYTRFLGPTSSVSVQAYYNGAYGWFRLWDDEVARNALQQFGIDGYFVGSVVTYTHASGPFSLSAGFHGGSFTRDHVLDIVGGSRAYTNTGHKKEADGFVKLGYDAGPWHLYGDAQLRWAKFRYHGRVPLGSVSWTFFNPKVGVSRDLGQGVSAYLSVGRAEREPTRNDMLAGEDDATVRYDLGAVKPEKVVDVESGVKYARKGLDVAADVYAMEFRDEIALAGELSPIGLPLRRNVDRSYRRGIEVDLLAQLHPKLHLRWNANASRNRIRDWTQFYDVYDPAGTFVGSTSRKHHDVEPLLTPVFTTNVSLAWTPAEGTILELTGRHVSTSHLDNTGNDDFVAPSYGVADASAIVSLARWIHLGTPQLRVQVNNLLDNDRVWPNGYSYLFFQQHAGGRSTLDGIPYYYPLAGRTIFAGLEIHL